MGSEEHESPPSCGKHRRSPAAGDEDAEESSKRRKHRHHHHHHRHHRRHGRHGRDREEGVDLPPALEAEAEAEAAPSNLLKSVDDEREEGEILEEEDGGGDAVLDPVRDSDVESGEIEQEAMDTAPNPDTKSANHESSLIQSCDYSSKKGDDKVEDLSVADNSEALKNYGAMSERLNGETDIPVTGMAPDGEELETGSEGEARRRQSKSQARGTEKGKKYRDADADDLRSRARLRSPVSRENLHLMKHSRRDDRKTRDLNHNSDRTESRRHQESLDDDRRVLDRNDRYKDTRSSPEACHKDRSRSRDSNREKSYEPGREPYTDGSAGAYQFDSKVMGRSDSEHKQDSKHDRLDHYLVRSRDTDKGIHRERERSSSYSRRDGREERHGSRDRGRDIERYHLQDERHGSRDRGSERGRHSSSARDRNSVEVDRVARRERERSSSYSRRDGREERHGSRDRGRDIERYNSSSRDKDKEKPRDAHREGHKERERLNDANSERERLKDWDGRDRGRTNNRDYRERERQIEKDRISTWERHRDSRHPKYNEREHHKERTRSKEFAKEVNSNVHNAERAKDEAVREENEEIYQERIEQQLAEQEEEDVDKIKEESRKRRQAILEKYKQQQMQQLAKSPSTDHEKEEIASTDRDNQELNAGNSAIHILHEDPENKHDPSDVYVADSSFNVGKSPIQNGVLSPERTAGVRGLGEGTPKSERSADMFCDDIFGESPAGVRKLGKGDSLQIERSGLHDNWDDAEGYYSYRLGEVLDGRFEIKSFHGKGVFSTVVRAKDLKPGKGDPEEVAIKIIRNNDTMYKAGLEELVILKKLAGADPEDKRHCVRFLSSFKYRNHLCLVFESLHMNLREVLKKFGRNIGLNLTAVRAYAKQLLIALKHLKNCGVLHCDIKPDNMLVNEAKNVLKLCDFGNAMFSGKNEITPYLVSRFYRAPEIILGLQYDHPMDIWSVGCCLYELYTGKVLFPGPSNNDMLRLHMELKGSFPKKMLRKGAFTDQHFDQDLNFHATEEDPVTKKTVKRLLLSIKPKDISTLISSSLGEDPKMLANFKDLLERIFILDPEKRMTVVQALSHPFITGK